jgi:DNA-binding transcriptional MocR family regulator
MVNRATSGKVARALDNEDLVHDLGDWATGSGPIIRQLARAIAGGIERGAIATGARLPSERSLAARLRVGRGTAVAAYDLLVGDGLIERRHGSGTFVVGAGDLALPAGREGTALVHRLVERSASDGPALVDLSISVLSDAAALPDVHLDGRDLVAVVPDTGYSPWGLPGLRAALAAELGARWDLPTTPEQVVVTTGAQQAISAAAACWVRPGDEVVVDDPTYPGAIAAFTAAGARLVGIPVARHGVDVGALAAALRRRPALVYLQSGPHSPTGAVLSTARRQAIADLVVEARVPLVEDVALVPLAWARVPPPIAALVPDAPIAVVGSLSKRFWGGLRLGWVRAPEPVALRFARVKATQDLGSSAVSQVVAERLLRSTDAGAEARVLDAHRARHDVLTGALRRALPSWTWTEPAGGLSLWVRLPDGADAPAFAQVALRHGVAVATAEALSADPSHHRDRLRLSFSGPPELLEEGVRRLAAAWNG